MAPFAYDKGVKKIKGKEEEKKLYFSEICADDLFRGTYVDRSQPNIVQPIERFFLRIIVSDLNNI